MSAYIVARVDVRDREGYREYTRHSPRLIEQFGGRFIVRGGEMVTLEGPEETHRIVIVEFPTLAQAVGFYRSPEYQAIKALRDGAGSAQFIAIDGYPLASWEADAAASRQLSLPAKDPV